VSGNSKTMQNVLEMPGMRARTKVQPASDAGKKSVETKFQIPSDTSLIGPTVDRIVATIRKARCLPGKEDDIAGALFEALGNAVLHGNHQQLSKLVRVVCRYEPSKCFSVIVKDEGSGFDPAAVPDPTRPENVDADHGRGIFLMRTYMDEVRYEAGGTEVHLVKYCERQAERTAGSWMKRMGEWFQASEINRRKS
jgi:serine/threonine-protein kinase RsbW